MRRLSLFILSLCIFFLFFVSISSGEETDPEVLDRIRIYEESKAKGITEISSQIQSLLNQAGSNEKMPVDIVINKRFLKSDVDAMIIGGRTYAPLRAICEAFSITDISWNEEAYRAEITIDGQEVLFPVNDYRMVVDFQDLPMDSPSLLVNGRILIPIRYLSEWLGFEVSWDGTFYTVHIELEDEYLNEDRLEDRFYTLDEMKTLSRLVMKEAGSVSYETMHGVASVVMNQVEHPGLESSIEAVIYDVSGSVHFPPAHKDGFDETIPSYLCVLAVKNVLRGENSVPDCIYFNTRPFKGKTVYKVSDGVYFCY